MLATFLGWEDEEGSGRKTRNKGKPKEWKSEDGFLAREMRLVRKEKERDNPLCSRLTSLKKWSSLFEPWKGSFRVGNVLVKEEREEEDEEREEGREEGREERKKEGSEEEREETNVESVVRLDKKIGEGGFGAVYSGRVISSSKGDVSYPRLAVKLFKTRRNDEGDRRMLVREVVVNSILFCGLKTDFVSEPLFAIRTRGRNEFAVAMRKMDMTLSGYLSSCPDRFKRVEFLQTTIQLAKGLLVLQERFGFVHGDLKLNNVMVTLLHEKGVESHFLVEDRKEREAGVRVHLIDFGLSMIDLTVGKKAGRFAVDSRYKRPVFNASHDFLNYAVTLPAFDDSVSFSCLTLARNVLSDFHRRLETDQDVRWRKLHASMLGLIEAGLSSSIALYWTTIHWLHYPPTTPEAIILFFSSELEKE